VTCKVKLLRVLQERELLRVGGTEPVRVDVRVVAATNRDLEREVRAGRFREDLFYRLNVIPIVLPPLRARRTDIALLVEHFFAKHAAPGRPRKLSSEALAAFVAYAWPGNVRELESMVERILLLSEGDEVRLIDLPAALRMHVDVNAGPAVELPDDGLDLELLERSLILRALDKAEGNVSRAARLLGLSRRTLQYRLEKIQTAPLGAPPAPDGAGDADESADTDRE
jgi:transcriptional regulator with PAS, ATPase and Fis domain